MTSHTEAPLVLVVEDNPAHAKLAGLLLQRAGYRVLNAATALDGLRLAAEWQPDLILMDIRLPDMSGIDAIRCLKQTEGTRSLPVIAVTAYLDENPETDIVAAGCIAIVAKPYHYKDLLAAVAAVLPNLNVKGQ